MVNALSHIIWAGKINIKGEKTTGKHYKYCLLAVVYFRYAMLQTALRPIRAPASMSPPHIHGAA